MAMAERGEPQAAPLQPNASAVITGVTTSQAICAMPTANITASTASTRRCRRKPVRDKPSSREEFNDCRLGEGNAAIASSGNCHQVAASTAVTTATAAAWNQPGTVSAPQSPDSLVLVAASTMPSGGPQKRPCERVMPKRMTHFCRSWPSHTSVRKIIASMALELPKPAMHLATTNVPGCRRTGTVPATAKSTLPTTVIAPVARYAGSMRFGPPSTYGPRSAVPNMKLSA
mmetsp:Transcript_88426/g.286315  ORF Transcript_88426/g.286315 Transcript_88426/m.286315 type:complete len:230 (-) Transcript_88426:466-1155(-)